MRIDLTLDGGDGPPRDVAVLARPGTRWAQVRTLLPGDWGRAVAEPDAVLGTGPLRIGAVLSASGAGTGPTPLSGHRLDVVGGPDAGLCAPLARVPIRIGRDSSCGLMLHDPRVSRGHAEVGLGARGAAVRDLGSAAGTSVDGLPVGPTAKPLTAGALLRLGDSFLQVRGPGSRTAAVRDGPDGTVLVSRAAVPVAADAPARIELPEPPRPDAVARFQWAGALLPAALGVTLAIAMHSPQFLLFALLSPLMVLGSAVGDRVHYRRRRRRSRRAYRRDLARTRGQLAAALIREATARRAAAPDPAALAAVAAAPGSGLWAHRHGDLGLLRVRIGLGDLPASTTVRDSSGARSAGALASVPVCVDLADGPLGLAGPAAATAAAARWVVGQLAVHIAPGDVQFRLLLTPAAEPGWRWARWLPQLAGPAAVTDADRAELLAALASLRDARTATPAGRPWTGGWVVLVVDSWAAAGDLPGLAELLRDGPAVGITAIVLDAEPGGLPACCASLATVVGDTGSDVRITHAGGGRRAVTDQVSPEWAEQLARALAPLRIAAGGAGGMPDTCTLLGILAPDGLEAGAVRRRWERSDGALRTVLGVGPGGPVELDLVRDGPHALVAGTTGSGKSELLRCLVAGLAVCHPPDQLGFVLVDYKGGAAFAECSRLPHTVGVVTDLDAHLATRALTSLECELRRRERLFAAAGARDLAGYRATRPQRAVPRLVIVVDEFAELAAELADFVDGLVGVARRGRSLGVHLVLATQRPAGVVSAEIRANTAIRIALRVSDAADSQDVLDAPDAVTLDRRYPGRAYLRVPGSGLVAFQTALVGPAGTGPEREPRVVALDSWRRPAAPADRPAATAHGAGDRALDGLAGTLRAAAAALRGTEPGPAPWLAPLPDTVQPEELTEAGDCDAGGPVANDEDTLVPIGLVDLPRQQRQEPLSIDLGAGGSLLLAGGARSGRTHALLALAITAAGRLPPVRLHLHVADHAGGGLAALAGLPHVGALTGGDIAASARLFSRLHDEVVRRRSLGSATQLPALLLLLDGWEQFLAAAEEHDSAGAVESLLALLRDGASAGLTVAVAGGRAALAPRLSSVVGTRLALRLTDRADYALAGLTERSLPADFPPGRAVRATDGAELQLAWLGDPARVNRRARAVARHWRGPNGPVEPVPGRIAVRPLPASVRLDTLDTAPAGGPRGAARVILGAGGDGADTLGVDLAAGRRRLLVAGPAGSGRSTLLLSLLHQLTAHGVDVVAAGPAHSPLPAAARARGATLLDPHSATPPEPPGAATVLLVDDCETLRDTDLDEALATWAAAGSGPAVVAAGRSDELALAFRGLAGELRRARCLVLLQPGPGDGELAGVRLPARQAGPRPGRGLVIGDPAWGEPFGAGPVPVQLAVPGPLAQPMCG